MKVGGKMKMVNSRSGSRKEKSYNDPVEGYVFPRI